MWCRQVAMFLPQIIARLKFGPDPVAATARASLAAIALGVSLSVWLLQS